MPFNRPDHDRLDEVQELKVPDAPASSPRGPKGPLPRIVRSVILSSKLAVAAALPIAGFADSEPHVERHRTIRLNLDDPNYDFSLPRFELKPDSNDDLFKKPAAIAGMSDDEFAIVSANWEQDIKRAIDTQLPVAGNDVVTFEKYQQQIVDILAASDDRISQDLATSQDRFRLRDKINRYLKPKGLYLFVSYEARSSEGKVEGVVIMLCNIVDAQYIEAHTDKSAKRFPSYSIELPPKYADTSGHQGLANPNEMELIIFPHMIEGNAKESKVPYKEHLKDVYSHEATHLWLYTRFEKGLRFRYGKAPLSLTFEIPLGDSLISLPGFFTYSDFQEVAAFGAQHATTRSGVFQHFLLTGPPAGSSSYNLHDALLPYFITDNAPQSALRNSLLGDIHTYGSITSGDAVAVIESMYSTDNLHMVGLDMYRVGVAMLTEAEKLYPEQ